MDRDSKIRIGSRKKCQEPLFELMGIHGGLVGADCYARHRVILFMMDNGS